MDKLLKDNIQSYFKIEPTISKDKLVDYILEDFPEFKKSSINVYLSRLKKEGVIKNPSGGLYAIEGKKAYSPKVDTKSRRLYNKIKKDYPFVEFCISNTKWLNEFMSHQPFKFYTVLELGKDVAESIFYALKEQGKQVYLEPDADTFNLYVSNSEEVIILKYLISEAPLQEVDKITVPTLEKLLVDMTIDTLLFAAQQFEMAFIFPMHLKSMA